MRQKIAAGNWKMHGLSADLREVDALMARPARAGVTTLLCPPATLLAPMAALVAGRIAIGGQDCHAQVQGAHTGDISAAMLADAGASHVILGHSERRADHGESDATVAAKVRAALAAGLIPVICVGETAAQHAAGATLSVITAQLGAALPEAAAQVIVAYEPVWAIGTGKVPTGAEIAAAHAALRAVRADMAATPILYGGSVKPENAAEIFALADVDGALVGGASLTAAAFGAIIDALETAPRGRG